MTYDVVRGSLTTLRTTHGDYRSSVTDCLASRQSAVSLPETSTPPVGLGFFYLVRGASCGGAGTYDESEGTGQATPRDAGIAQSPNACP